jgi:hypothetical protein
MNPDELIWRIDECDEEIKLLQANDQQPACEFVKARRTALQNQLVEEISHPSPGVTMPVALERVRRARPEQPEL